MIRARVNAFAHAFHSIPHTLCYSVKANSTLAILRLLAGEGAGFDVVSGGELHRVLRVSRKAASKVAFSGVGDRVAEVLVDGAKTTLMRRRESLQDQSRMEKF